jgi:hypoxanthine phosphoribosyltransferase
MTPGGPPAPLFTADQIAARVDALAADLATRLPPDPVVVGILVAAFVFTADLTRALGRHGLRPEVDFLRLSSYGPARQPLSAPRLIGPIPDVTDRTVLLVDTVLDTGHTLARATALLRDAGADRVHTCVLIDKPARRATPIVADPVGFTADGFLIGYGLDGGNADRWLPYVARLG